MRVYYFIAVCFFMSSAYGQTRKVVSIPAYENYKNEVDTSLWFKWKRDLAKQIGLKDLQTSTDTFHFRFWTDIQAIDIWTSDYRRFYGTITNYAQRYDDELLRKGIYKVGKLYSKQLSLDSSKSRQIFSMINRLAIVDIPSDNKINGWQQGFDGEEFLIELSTPESYDFKTYWTPSMFIDSLQEAKQIQALINYLFEDVKIGNLYSKLKLPAGTYLRNGIQGIPIKPNDQDVPGLIR